MFTHSRRCMVLEPVHVLQKTTHEEGCVMDRQTDGRQANSSTLSVPLNPRIPTHYLASLEIDSPECPRSASDGHGLDTSLGRCPGDLLLSKENVAILLWAPKAKLSKATLGRKVISVACIQMQHHDHQREFKCELSGHETAKWEGISWKNGQCTLLGSLFKDTLVLHKNVPTLLLRQIQVWMVCDQDSGSTKP